MKNYEMFEISNIKSLKLKSPTVYYYLKSKNFSESYISKLRTAKDSILLNDTPATLKFQIKDGDTLSIANNPQNSSTILPCDGNLDIIFEDDDFLLVNKPHNLACMPSRSHYSENLGGIICKYMQSKDKNFVLRIVNRLDKDTTGLVLIAKNLIAYNSIKDFKKEYYAICYGNFDEKSFTINSKIETIQHNGINQMKRIVSNDGKSAITHVEVIENFDDFSLIKLTLETGRTHQIRVHLSSIKHPLLGDKIYIEEDKILSQFPFTHTMLLLKKISFTHFRTNQTMEFEINFPPLWTNFLETKQI